MTAKEIIRKYLRAHGYDGLYCDEWSAIGGERCGCFVDDLCPCNPETMQIDECKAGVRIENEDGSVGIGPREEEE